MWKNGEKSKYAIEAGTIYMTFLDYYMFGFLRFFNQNEAQAQLNKLIQQSVLYTCIFAAISGYILS